MASRIVFPERGAVDPKKRDDKVRSAWAQAKSNCQACGIPATLIWERSGVPHSVHHIVKTRPKADEPCNWLFLCAYCHSSVEGVRIVDSKGRRWPRLTNARALWIKLHSDPTEWDPDRLEALWGRSLPELEPVDRFYLLERSRWDE